MGTIHMRWATGSSLGLIEGEDLFEVISRPRREKGLITVHGDLYDHLGYDEEGRLHKVTLVDIDEDGNLTNTGITWYFDDEELKDNRAKFTQTQWIGIVKHFIRQNHELEEDQISDAAEDIVCRCFVYGIPTVEELPEYIAEYLDR
jgi:hypothetical protein